MKLLNADCLPVMQKMLDKSVDLVLTDPPYDLEQDKKVAIHEQFMRITKTGVIVFSPPENPWIFPATQYGFWIKPISTKNTTKRMSRFVEQLFFYGELKWNADRHWSQQSNVFMDLVESNEHPNEKPMSLITRLIKNHSDVGDTIFDPFMGSGTTGVVCVQTGREFKGIEENLEYFNIAKMRTVKSL